jgi:putative DNA primase/helicase
MDKPAQLEIKHENIPRELKEKDQWCLWKWELRDGRWTKPPYTPKGTPAKSNDPATWSTYAQACAAVPHFDGLGFMFSESNGYVGLDWDNARDPEDGRPRDWVKRYLQTFNSYTEISPSGKGFKTIVKGTVPKDHHGEKIGLFSKTRYFCVTGHVLPDYSSNIEPRQTQLTALVKEYWPGDLVTETQEKPKPQSMGNGTNDDEILKKAMDSDDKFRRLFKGNYGDYSSQSEGDLALCSKLAFWVGPDPARIDTLFRRSGLMRPKWDREDYAKRTIDRALATVSEQYQQVKPASSTVNTGKKSPPATGTTSSRVSEAHIYTPERMATEYRDYVKSLEKQRFITGIKEIDHCIRGVAGGEVLTLLARAGCFKTTMLQHLLMRYAQNSQWSAVFFSLEMPVSSLAERYLQMIGEVSGRAVENAYKEPGKSDMVETLEQVFLEDLKGLYVVPVKVSLDDVKGYVRLVEAKFQVKVGVLGIDYLGLLDEPGKNEYEIVSRLARDIKGLAKELSMPIVLLSQTSRRAGSGEIEISMDMARGSGAVEESADFCLGLFQSEQPRLSTAADEPSYDVVCKILKNRKGPKGLMFKLDLDAESLRLGDTAEAWTPPRKGKGNDL